MKISRTVLRTGVPAICLLFFVGLAAPLGAQTIAVPRQSEWAFEATGTDLGTAWRDTVYNDSGWPTGAGILGYGETFIDTPVPFGPDANNKPITVYFRTQFTLADPASEVNSLFLAANYDDGFVAYLNGTEIDRRSLPAGTITFSTTANSHEGGAYETANLSGGVPNLVDGVNHLAIEVHQRLPSSSDLVMDMEFSYSTGVTVVRGPYLQIGTPTSVIVRWRTDVTVPGWVRYGTHPDSLWQSVSGPATNEHELALTGLLPDTRYYYSVGTDTETLEGGPDFFFDTSPPAGTATSTRVWVLGDSGTKGASAAAVRDGFFSYTGSREPDVWLMLGDNAYSTGTDSEYQAAVFDMYPSVLQQCVLWPTRGNHDVLHTGANNDYYEIFSLPDSAQAGGTLSGDEAYYSFDFGNLHFVCLDSEGSNLAAGGDMLLWLEQDLQNTTQDWIIAYWHHPPYTKGSHNSDNASDSGGRMRDMRENALPILEANGVDLVLSGHSHSYERSYLLDGHYEISDSLEAAMILDGGDGRTDGDGAYDKPTLGPAAHEGAVYVVAGSSGKTSGGTLNHPVMYASLNLLGSLVLDVDGNQLDATFVNTAGTDEDHFSIVKGGSTGIRDDSLLGPRLLANHPNPFQATTRIGFTVTQPGPVRVSVFDVHGKRLRVLMDKPMIPGDYEVVWDGLTREGAAAPPGVYFTLLESENTKRTRKLVLTP